MREKENKMKLIFMGTPDFSVPALRALAQEHEIAAVYCQPPRPAGRGKTKRATPVELCARSLNLPVHHPTSLKNTEVQNEIKELNADIAVIVAYGILLPPAILQMPRFGCVNIHASLLPRWRGAAPIHRAIMAGDRHTGISIMQMDAGLDTGPVLLRQEEPISENDTTPKLHDRLSKTGAALILKTLDNYSQLSATAQSKEGITYATKINKSEAQVDFNQSAQAVDRLIRGLTPFPGAFTKIGNERVKLLNSRLTSSNGKPGQVLEGFVIACKEGAVEILEAQREGKRPLPASEIIKTLRLPSFL